MTTTTTEDDSTMDLSSMFTEEPRPPTPEPTFSVYTREPPGRSSRRQSTNDLKEIPGGEEDVDVEDDWNEIKIRLVGNHPLWAHHLWNAALALATYLDQDENIPMFKNRNVLELGAGGSLPSIVTVKNGASKAVITDYPDADLISNVEYNVDANLSEEQQARASVQGYIWGKPVEDLLKELGSNTASAHDGSAPAFDLIILSDLIFNHSQHDAMLKTCELSLAPASSTSSSLTPSPSVLVFYTHHRPHLAHRDMGFFDKARERGWYCEEVLTRKFPPMFPEDPGEEEVRATVHGWKLTRNLV